MIHRIVVEWDPEMDLAVIETNCNCPECTFTVDYLATALENLAGHLEIV